MPFVDEVEKVDEAVQSVTSRWKTWLVSGGFLFAVVLAVYIFIKFWT